MKESLHLREAEVHDASRTPESRKSGRVLDLCNAVKRAVTGCLASVQQWNTGKWIAGAMKQGYQGFQQEHFAPRSFLTSIGGRDAALATVVAGTAMVGSGAVGLSRPAYAQEASATTEWGEPVCFDFTAIFADELSNRYGAELLEVTKEEDGTLSGVITAEPKAQEEQKGWDLYRVEGEGRDNTGGPWGELQPMSEHNTTGDEEDYISFSDGRIAVLSSLRNYPFTQTLTFDGIEVAPQGEISLTVSKTNDENALLVSLNGRGGGEIAGIPLDALDTIQWHSIPNNRYDDSYPTQTIHPQTGELELWYANDSSGNYKIRKLTGTEDGLTWSTEEEFSYSYQVAMNPVFTQTGEELFFDAQENGVWKTCMTSRPGAPTDPDADGDGWTVGEGDCNDSDPSIGKATDGTCDGDSDGEIDATAGGSDCNDNDNRVGESKSEICTDGIDNDCDTKPDSTDPDCATQTDNDGDGYAEDEGDCNDGNSAVHPGAAEICTDGIDNNCDGKKDTADTVACANYIDNDSDGYTEYQGDCNDGNSAVHPEAIEGTGDGVDQNCDGAETCYLDGDNDNYRPNSTSIKSSSDVDCTDSGEAISSDLTGDCDDGNASINPGKAEVPYNGKNDDCNSGTRDDDLDSDGYLKAQDCDDQRASVNPGAAEICTNGRDDDCDTRTDMADTEDCTPETDDDSDGWSIEEGDCDDADPSTHPEASDANGDAYDKNCDRDYGPATDQGDGIEVWSENPVTIDGGVISTGEDPAFDFVVEANGDIILNSSQGQFEILGSGGFASGPAITAHLIGSDGEGEKPLITTKNMGPQDVDVRIDGETTTN